MCCKLQSGGTGRERIKDFIVPQSSLHVVNQDVNEYVTLIYFYQFNMCTKVVDESESM